MQYLIKILAIFLLIGADQYSKFYARENWHNSQEVFSFFYLKWVENTGIAFSMSVNILAVKILTILVALYLLYHIFFKKNVAKSDKMIYILILSGAIGNLIDRFHHQSVTDFLSFWSFPVFNFADIYISVGVFFYIFFEIFSGGDRSRDH
jgi:signal peptidase II